MDVHESEEALQKHSAVEIPRPPLLPADKNNGTTHRSRTREVSSRYRSPTPSTPSGSRRCPSPTITRTVTTSSQVVPKRAISAERKRPSTPPSPPRPSTPVHDTQTEMQLASRNIMGSRLPEVLWPSTMRSLSVSFQSDTFSLPMTKKEKPVTHALSDRALKPSSNVAQKQAETPVVSRKPTPERKRSPLKGKNATDQSENSKPVDGLHARLVDQHRWPSRTGGKVTSNALTRSMDLTDKAAKIPTFPKVGIGVSSLRRMSLPNMSKPLLKSASDAVKLVLYHDCGNMDLEVHSVDDIKLKESGLHKPVMSLSLERMTLLTPAVRSQSSPVSPGTGCPKVLKIDVRGELMEGNIIRGYAEVAWCGGTPGKGVASWLRRRWNSSPVVIVGAEDEEYQLILDDIDSCLVFMYTPVTEEGAKGEPQYAITDYVKPALPSVSDVKIIGDAVEGNTIKGVGKYFGGREGPSRFEWLREDKNSGEFVLVSTGTTEYAITKEDVGRQLAFVYIPTNLEGQEGKSVSIVSQIVKQAPPKVANVKIIGDIREGSKVTVTGTVTGGTEGSSRVQWFKTSSSTLDGENGLEAVSTSKIAKAFRIPLGAVGYFIVAKFTPMTPDGESGEPAYAISKRAVENLPPSLNFLSITGDYSEGGILTASYGYIGGHEGKSIYNWCLHEVETDSGTPIPEVFGLLQYRVTKDAIGKFTSFTCTPVRNDGIVGESRTCMGQERVRPGSPRLLSLQIVGTAVEGSIMTVDRKYWGGEEGESVFRWFRTSSDGTHSEIKDATTSSYMLSVDDIGFFISVSCEPVRSDWARGPVVLSEQIGPIIPGPPSCQLLEFHGSFVEGERLSFFASYSGGEKGDCLYEWFRVKSNGVKDKLNAGEFFDLTIEDVGRRVELVYTPVRKDGVKGTAKSVMSSVVAPADPMGLELVIPDCCEDKMVVPQKKYFGGQEGDSEYVWYRTKNILHGPVLMDISNACDVFICGKTLTYTPSLEDIGAYLALYWLPTRADGKCGKPLVSICNSSVTPALPVVSNVHVKELSSGTYFGEGEYFGGYEGPSLFSWYRETNEGTIILINGANSRTYQVTDSDYNCRLLFGYMPVRSDSVVGERRLSEPTDIILPELLKIEMLALTGKAVEGDVLTAVEVIPKSEIQQHVWGKYKNNVRYQWFCSSETGNDVSLEPLSSQRSCSYKVRLEDIGRCLRCECIVTDVFGRSSQSAYAETAPILPGIPRIDKLEIEGRGFHTNLYAVRGIYSGGKEGKSRIQWLRSMVGSPDLISIPGETGRMYESNVDDVGYRLVALYTPVREDGVEGQPVSASTEPIAVEPDILKEVKQKLDLGSVKFEALCDKDRSPKKVPGMGSLERRILEVNRKRIKVVKPGSKTSFPTTEIRGSYAPPFHVELFRNEQHRIRIVVDSENEVDLLVQTRHLRDVIVLVIRGLAQRFNSTSLNSLLKIDT